MKIRANGESISTETYRALRARILLGEIPPGSKVTTPGLCKAFGASLGAVREALSRLRAEGLITAEAHRGYRVSPTSIDDLRDLTKVRVDIESVCLARSIELGGLDWECGIMACAHRFTRAYADFRPARNPNPNPELEELHRAFHRSLVSACGSPRLLRMREQLFDESERYWHLDGAIERERDPIEEHRQLAEAVLARDVKRAQVLLAGHIGCTTDVICNAMLAREEHSSRRERGSRANRRAAKRGAAARGVFVA